MSRAAKSQDAKPQGPPSTTTHVPAPGAPETDVAGAPEAASEPTSSALLVVGVGASAGGLEAFTELLKPLPKKPGLAFVLIPHLDPKHESAMTELLARATKMQVRQVHDKMKVKPDFVYVLPPNQSMTIQKGVLMLAPRETEFGSFMPIDTFLRSLAADRGKNAVGVILSGTASDGTQGAAAIKNEGGITFAQDAHSAKYSGMPNHAIASGCIDFVLPPHAIARELLRIREHPYLQSGETEKLRKELQAQGNELEQIFRLLRKVRKVDFSDYKPATIQRRIHRRMALRKVDTIAEYLQILQKNTKEVEALHHDILINVTSFFRDPEAFLALETVVYPAVLQERRGSETIRVWVPGCSTGEEAYSHAIALLEYVSRIRADASIQIFATDISEDAIHIARNGIYRESIAADVSPPRLRHFFSKVERGYQISKAVRDVCVFATQNVFNDPPFSRMDLVSCRNVLIYMGQVLQKRVIPIFHYALKPTGFLMVGNTEGIVGVGSDLFEPADKRHKIYRKRLVTSPVVFGTTAERFEHSLPPSSNQAAAPVEGEPPQVPAELRREADRMLLNRYAPAAVVVNDRFDILQIRGDANRYLELPSGKATLNLLNLAKPRLLFELQHALESSRSKSLTVRRENLQFETQGASETVSIQVIPFQAPLQPQQSYLVIFERVEGPGKVEPVEPQREPTSDEHDRIEQLKQELAATKEYLQSIIEALEASNEELQSANEEIQSGNEELQSTNEELQTSKEELESANEELNTVNEEMQHRNLELSEVNNDLLNLLSSANIPIIMLDSSLNVRRVTPEIHKVLGISAADVGKPIGHLRLRGKIENLQGRMLNVIENLKSEEVFVEGEKNRKYRLRITPYRTLDNRIEGVVLAFMDRLKLRRAPTSRKKGKGIRRKP